MARSKNVEPNACDCSFVINEAGAPEVQCPDPESQAAVLAALTQFPDLPIRVVPVLVGLESPASEESHLVTDTNGVDFEVGDSDFGDDPDFDDDDPDDEEE